MFTVAHFLWLPFGDQLLEIITRAERFKSWIVRELLNISEACGNRLAQFPQRGKGRKSNEQPVAPPQISRIAKTMALAIQMHQLIREGLAQDQADLARLSISDDFLLARLLEQNLAAACGTWLKEWGIRARAQTFLAGHEQLGRKDLSLHDSLADRQRVLIHLLDQTGQVARELASRMPRASVRRSPAGIIADVSTRFRR